MSALDEDLRVRCATQGLGTGDSDRGGLMRAGDLGHDRKGAEPASYRFGREDAVFLTFANAGVEAFFIHDFERLRRKRTRDEQPDGIRTDIDNGSGNATFQRHFLESIMIVSLTFVNGRLR
jgi:hypothetical protein